MKTIHLMILISLSFISLNARDFTEWNKRWFYADVGVGVDHMTVSISLDDPKDKIVESHGYIAGPNLNIRFGLRPLKRLAIIADLQIFVFYRSLAYYKGIDQRLNRVEEGITLSNYIGAGLIFYPYHSFQLGLSLGVLNGTHYTIYFSDSWRNRYYDSVGAAINFSIAYEFRVKDLMFLVGSRYFDGLLFDPITMIFADIPGIEVHSIGLFTKIKF